MNTKNILKTGLWILTIIALTSGCGQSVNLDELDEWDLVYITDNSEAGAQYYLPGYIEEDTVKKLMNSSEIN